MSKIRIKTGKRNTTVTRTKVRTAVKSVKTSSGSSKSRPTKPSRPNRPTKR